ncbi:efflux transporter periplasmic adaptor subunit [Hydrogenovibrio sp. SC-1]|uniref:efflux RND transporter periplasmic adaptor subunit n=1 Tax=Hydrogenovibrio sp. SC-1 TaxID=2065820 RepID=UPI000C7A4934|nr:efflux RND transporter periplasmic adaptor subunit [Hydrogenovibrio sp. SC-1]PLA74572.1 efflux transporter periplasmic adaptor subunit [Hydrogenovibrio sp. SC-1]
MRKVDMKFALKWGVFGIGVLWLSFGTAAPKTHFPVPVIAYEVIETASPVKQTLLGSLEAKSSIDVVAKATDVITAIYFKEGEWVRKSALLVEQNAEEELALLEESKELEAEAKRQYDRVKGIEGKGSVTVSLIDERYRLWKTAAAKRKVIQAQVADRRIYAPFSGQLGFRQLSEGAFVTAGTKIVSLDDTSQMILDLLVPERYLSGIHLEQPIEVRTEAYRAEVFTGHVSAISPRVDPVMRMVQVRAMVDNPKAKLKTNMMVEAQLVLKAQASLKIPNSAIEMLGDRQFVYRLQPNGTESYGLEKVEIETGQKGHNLTEILQGLAAGDKIVSQGLMGISLKRPVVIKAMQTGQDQASLLQKSLKGTLR